MRQTGGTESYLGIAYLNPTNKFATCNAELAAANVNTYTIDDVEYTTPTEIDSGCMKWYIYKEDSTNYYAILDHNTTARVKWNAGNNNVALASSNLQPLINDLKSAWVNSETVNSFVTNVDIITAQEVSDIVGNSSWTAGGSWYYLDPNGTTFGQTQVANSTNKSDYSWLYDYTYDCEQYGCNMQDNNTYTNVTDNSTGGTSGYWTSTPSNDSSAIVWGVFGEGYLANCIAKRIIDTGLRPVITISKSDIN